MDEDQINIERPNHLDIVAQNMQIPSKNPESLRTKALKVSAKELCAKTVSKAFFTWSSLEYQNKQALFFTVLIDELGGVLPLELVQDLAIELSQCWIIDFIYETHKNT